MAQSTAKPPAKRRLTAREIVERNNMLVRRRIEMPLATWAELAAEFDVSVRQAQDIVKAFRDDNKKALVVEAADHLGLIAEKIADFRALRQELAVIGREADNQSARVGALKQVVELHIREIALLQSTGLLPHDLGVVRVELNARFVAEQLDLLIAEFVPKAKRQAAELRVIELMAGGAGGSD